MLKVLVGIAIVGFTTLCGYLLSKKYRQRKQFFRQFKEFNERFLNEIAYYRRPIQEFASMYAYQGEFNELLQAYFSNLEERALNERKILDLPTYSFLKEDEKIVIADYFLMLGKGDSTSQKNYFSSIKEVLMKYQNESTTVSKRYEDLYIKLGFLCGLFILILII